jgi:glycosyltransferase involved in cell wall biosynthesis
MVLPYTCSADVGVTYIDNGSLNDRLCLPNKMFEYIMAGLPVIVNDAPEMRRVVEEYRIGVILESLTGESLARALDEIDRLDRGVLAENLKRAASVFSWENQEKVMLGAYGEHVWGVSGGKGR